MRIPRNGRVSGSEARMEAALAVLAPSICFAAAESDLCRRRHETVAAALVKVLAVALAMATRDSRRTRRPRVKAISSNAFILLIAIRDTTQ